ncbi:MAG: Fe-Mn family superoxide dismutase [Candidatus Yanofskybacteria bacterium]|nr:Fe-Mn family superoxide dismutase [Candidatus Yanofskybacteria bacterium]
MTDPKPLPFKPGSLKGISEKAILIHHDKLYAGYVKKAGEISEKLKGKVEAIKSGEEVEGNATYSELRALKSEETFATNGVYLHEWYFDVLGGDGAFEKAPELVRAMTEKWGSLDVGLKYFSACGMAARGWSVLCWDIKDQRLRHYNADAHNQGGIWGCVPIITLDCYEHAYFLDYGSDKKAYIEDFWKNLDWKKAEEFYLKVSKFAL